MSGVLGAASLSRRVSSEQFRVHRKTLGASGPPWSYELEEFREQMRADESYESYESLESPHFTSSMSVAVARGLL